MHIIKFATPAEFRKFVLGPDNQDEHVKTRLRYHVQLDSIARAAYVEKCTAEWIANYRARKAVAS